ncbi:MAG: lipid-A-disaccharide synthase [Burkholderiaceae bacterium]
MVAGEASGDLLAGLLLDGMRARWPDMVCNGIGGMQMQRRGFDAWWPSDRLAVRGYVEVLRHYRDIVQIRDRLRARLLDQRPDIFIGIDAPDFNLGLERDLKQSGVHTVQFVCPSVWAWRAERLARMRASVDHVLCLFPFEPELLRRHGIAATYVGHPLAGVIPMQVDQASARAALGLRVDDSVLAILPGSRSSEIQYLARRFLDAAALVKRAHPGIRLLLPAVPALASTIRALVHELGMDRDVQVLDGQSHLVLAACDVTLIASGTATLEAALYKRPMVIAYNMHWLSWQIMRRKRLQSWVGLPNILCRDFVVPELLQDQASPVALALEIENWLAAPERIAALQQRFTTLHRELLRDTPTLATDALEKILAS